MGKIYDRFVVGLIAFFFCVIPSHIQATSVTVAVFVRDGCTHCQAEERFLDSLKGKNSDFSVTYYRLEEKDSRTLWEEFTRRNGLTKVTPITIVGNHIIIGFASPESTGRDIVNAIRNASASGIATDLTRPDLSVGNTAAETCPDDGSVPCIAEPAGINIPIPVFGSINSQKFPLFILSIVLGFIDGFNPCAMWVLITFLVILLQAATRKKMMVFAGLFIMAEAIMYTLILTVWYKTWDFVSLDSLVTPIIGAVSVIGGILFIREWRKKELECKVTDLNQRQKTNATLRRLVSEKFSFLTVIGILGVAFSVNIIEFACSIGIPQAFTKILELNRVTGIQSVGFISLYILFYMVDDLIVFGLAILSAEKLALSTKYSKWSNLVGGIIMVLLGFLLIIRPAALQF